MAPTVENIGDILWFLPPPPPPHQTFQSKVQKYNTQLSKFEWKNRPLFFFLFSFCFWHYWLSFSLVYYIFLYWFSLGGSVFPERSRWRRCSTNSTPITRGTSSYRRRRPRCEIWASVATRWKRWREPTTATATVAWAITNSLRCGTPHSTE